MNNKVPENLKNFESLVEVVAHLRGPEGCPWDKEQTHQSLAPYTIEEAHELVDALERQNQPDQENLLKEELGDLLFQVVLHAQLAQERGAFDISDVIAHLNEKMVRRHPHVFGDTKVENSAEVLKNWEEIKKQEKKDKILKGHASSFELPKSLPSLYKALKIGQKTEKLKFDWEDFSSVIGKVKEEIAELEECLNDSQDRKEEELGDLLFAIAQTARHLKLEPETALRKANDKFELRFFKMLKLAQDKKLEFTKLNLGQKEELWQEVKTLLKSSKA